MSDLTQEEINELATQLGKTVVENEELSVEEVAEQRFNSALEYVRTNPKFMKMSIEDIFKWFYMLGVNTDSAKEMDINAVAEFIEQVNFLQLMEDAVKNPESVPKSMFMNIDDENNKVTLTAECVGYDCACSPQREDHCTSESDTCCAVTITMKQFNNMIKADK